jgi:hypothetical protein
MYTFEEYQKVSALAALITGTITGYLKYSDMSKQQKQMMAKQLQWCYEKAEVSMLNSVKEDISKVLSK